MSVINNVLNDLAARQSQFTPIDIAATGSKPRTRPDPRLWSLLVILLLVLMAISWNYLRNQPVAGHATPGAISDDEQMGIPAIVELPLRETVVAEMERTDMGTARRVVEVLPATTEEADVNQIIGLQIRESESDMRLEFELQDKVVAYLKERGENRFGYHLRDVESQIAAPRISDNPWIRQLSIVASDSGVDISFETAANILVETRQRQVAGEPVWAIDLRLAAVDEIPETGLGLAREDGITPQPAVSVTTSGTVFEVSQETTAEEPQTPVVEVPSAVVKLDIRSSKPNGHARQQLEYAVELINSRRFGDAELLLQSLKSGVEDHAARQHLLALYQRQNSSDRFRRLARESMTAYPADVLFVTEYGRSLFQMADYRAVINLLARKERLEANQHALLAASYQRLDEHENAVRHYQLALENDAGNAKNWIGLGISQEHTAALQDALDSYQRAVSLGNLNSRLLAFVDKRRNTLKQVLN